MKTVATNVAMLGLAILLTRAHPAEAGHTVFVGSKAPSPLISLDQIDHARWNSLLHKYVDSNGMVNYRAWKTSPTDTASLSTYLTELSAANLSLESKVSARFAFWINAYNAVTIHGILREYPTKSIRNHTAKLVGYNIWKDLQLYVGGRPYSLEEIEHQVLRKMGDPRIHFAIVCASKGCPRLLNEAYVTPRLHEQLETNAKDFFSRATNFRVEPSKGIGLSAILDWFEQDFGSNEPEMLKRIAAWLPMDAARQVATQPKLRVTYLDYDWSINEQH